MLLPTVVKWVASNLSMLLYLWKTVWPKVIRQLLHKKPMPGPMQECKDDAQLQSFAQMERLGWWKPNLYTSSFSLHFKTSALKKRYCIASNNYNSRNSTTTLKCNIVTMQHCCVHQWKCSLKGMNVEVNPYSVLWYSIAFLLRSTHILYYMVQYIAFLLRSTHILYYGTVYSIPVEVNPYSVLWYSI